MGVDHRRANVAMAQEFLHCANVIAGSQQVRGKRMPKRVACDSFGQSGLSDSLHNRLLDKRFVNMVPSLFAGFSVYPAMLLRECDTRTVLK
jgi:hypothetical protein